MWVICDPECTYVVLEDTDSTYQAVPEKEQVVLSSNMLEVESECSVLGEIKV